MAEAHACANCRKQTNNNDWLCEDCVYAAQRAQAELPAQLGRTPNFAESDEARQQALVRRFHEVNG